MTLGKIIEDNGIKTVSEKTLIPQESIQALADSDFSTLNKVKSKGFIDIIEREFKADLSELKEEVDNYYAEHDGESSVGAIINSGVAEQGGSALGAIIKIAIVAGIIAAGYFFADDIKGLIGNLTHTTAQSSHLHG